MTTDVAVIIPARDAEQFIAEALTSVAFQTVRPREVIVVDHGSTDRTTEVAGRFGAVVLLHPCGPLPALRNAGIALARTPILAFLDADDLWRPRKLERQLAMLAAHPELGFVGCRTHLFCSSQSEPPAWWKPEWDDAESSEPSLLPSAVLARRSAFETAGPYDEDWSLGEDLEWTARAQDAGIARALVDEVLVDRRVHAGSASGDHEAAASRHLAIVRESVRRKRVTRGG